MRTTHLFRSLGITVVVGAALWLACGVDLEMIDSDEPCKSVGYSIAARTRICADDEELAKKRYASFLGSFHCTAGLGDTTGEGGPFACSIAVNAMTCAQVKSCGDNLACWLSAFPSCQKLMAELADAGSDGTAPEGGGGTGGAAGASGQGGQSGQGGEGDGGKGGEPGHGGSAGAGASSGSGGTAGTGGDAGVDADGSTEPPIVQLAAPDGMPGGLAMDSDSVYFTVRGVGADSGKVFSVNKLSGAPIAIATGLQCDAGGGGPAGLAVDDTDVYVAVEGCDTVVRIPKAGGTPTTVLSMPGGGLNRIAAHDNQLFVGVGAPPKVTRVNKDGTGQVDLIGFVAGAKVSALAVGATDIFMTVYGFDICLQSNPFDKSDPNVVATGYENAEGLVLDGTGVFFTNAIPSGKVLYVEQSGTSLPVEFSSAEPTPSGIAVDADKVYWARRLSGEIVSKSKAQDAGTVEVIASSQSEPGFVAADDAHVFWTTQVPPWTVMRALK